MPCFDGMEETYRKEAEEAQKAKIIGLEEMLCSACRVLSANGFDFDQNPMLSKWWENHKHIDDEIQAEALRKRLRREQAWMAAQKPFSKLTKEEFDLLKEQGFLK